MGGADAVQGGAHRNSSSFKFRAMYSGDSIYFLYEVKDNVLISNGADRYGDSSWKNDSIFLFISEDGNNQNYNAKTYILTMVLDDTGSTYTVHCHSGTYNKKNESQYTTRIVEKDANGYHAYVEAKIPLNDPSYIQNGGHIAFETQCHDPDVSNGTRDAIWAWAINASNGPNQNKGQWGHLRFVEKTASFFDHHASWRYMTGSLDLITFDEPEADQNWNTDLAASSAWASANAPFGVRAPGCTKAWNTAGTPTGDNSGVDGTAENAYFWAVREVILTADDIAALGDMPLLTSSFHDENFALYINGIKLYDDDVEMALYRTYKIADKATDVLKEGSNIIAVRSYQESEGYEFDMNLFATSGDTTKYPAKTAFETLSLPDAKNYELYYQTRANGDGTYDCRIVIMADADWISTLSSMESVVTFTADGQESVEFTAQPNVVYKKLTAPSTVYVAGEGVVIFGWIITDVPADYLASAPTAVLNVQ